MVSVGDGIRIRTDQMPPHRCAGMKGVVVELNQPIPQGTITVLLNGVNGFIYVREEQIEILTKAEGEGE